MQKVHCAWLLGLAMTAAMIFMEILSVLLLFSLLTVLQCISLSLSYQWLCELDVAVINRAQCAAGVRLQLQ